METDALTDSVDPAELVWGDLPLAGGPADQLSVGALHDALKVYLVEVSFDVAGVV